MAKGAQVALRDVALQPAQPALSTEPIDRGYLARFTLGNAGLEREVLELFAAQTVHCLEQLSGAQGRKAWKDAAHTLKGSARAVGAWRLANLVQIAELLDVEAALPGIDEQRARTLAAVAEGAEEARRYIACLYATG